MNRKNMQSNNNWLNPLFLLDKREDFYFIKVNVITFNLGHFLSIYSCLDRSYLDFASN